MAVPVAMVVLFVTMGRMLIRSVTVAVMTMAVMTVPFVQMSVLFILGCDRTAWVLYNHLFKAHVRCSHGVLSLLLYNGFFFFHF